MAPVISSKRTEVYLRLKEAAKLAVEYGLEVYDFRRISAAALTQAAIEAEDGNKSAAARRLKISRGHINKRPLLTELQIDPK